MFMWLRLRNVKEKKRHLSFPPPWEFQTPFSSPGTLDFLSTCLGTASLIFLFLSNPIAAHQVLITDWEAIRPERIRPSIKCSGGPLTALHTLRPSYLVKRSIALLAEPYNVKPWQLPPDSLKASALFAFSSVHYQESTFVSFECMEGL